MDASIWVGETEKHEISIKIGFLSGKYTVFIDNVPHTNFYPKNNSEVSFMVGDSEKHKIDVKVEKGLLQDKICILCDDKEVLSSVSPL